MTLTPNPAPGWRFQGWSGGCLGTEPCVVTMDANNSVTATFVQQFSLTVTCVGSGSVSPQKCPSTLSYPAGTGISLTATAVPGYVFAGWSDGCKGTGLCQLTMDANQSVTASFSPRILS